MYIAGDEARQTEWAVNELVITALRLMRLMHPGASRRAIRLKAKLLMKQGVAWLEESGQPDADRDE